MQMNPGRRGGAWWPLVLAIGFFSICMLLTFSYPSSFWIVTDYEPLGLADALNMAYRLADRQMYEAVGMAYHPGVTLYLLSWLASPSPDTLLPREKISSARCSATSRTITG
jgi:hypothetical protein